MGILSSLGDWLSSLLTSLLDAIVTFVRKYWWVLVIIAVIAIAPYTAAWLAASGAPGWLTAAVGWVATTVTPILTSVGSAIWGGLTAVGGYISSASLTTKAMMVLAAGLLLDEDATIEFIEEVAEDATELAVDVATAVISGVSAGTGVGSWLLLGIAGFVAWKYFTRQPDSGGNSGLTFIPYRDRNEGDQDAI